MRIILSAIALVLALDVLGFMLWAFSGQYPSDNFYVGTITAHVLGALIN